MNPLLSSTLAVATLLSINAAPAQQPTVKPAQPLSGAQPATAAKAAPSARQPIYDEAADAEQLVAAALAVAKRDHQRVLLMYGGNWCGWCHLLHATLTTDPLVRPAMDDYLLVHVDIGHGEKHAALSTRFGSDHRAHGYPYLTVLDADAKPIAHKDTAELEDGPAHDPRKVLEFLREHAPTPLDAAQVLATAQAAAKANDRLLFVHIGAPWSSWCHRLEAWMARPEVAALLAKEFIDVKIDQDRMTNGVVVAALLRQGKSGGIPWIALMNDRLQPIVTSDGPQGNVGFPAKPEEIEHFAAMLHSAKRHLSDADIEALTASLRGR